MGDSYLVTSLDLDSHTAFVRPFWDNYHTLARRETETRILGDDLQDRSGPLSLYLGQISVRTRVVAFQKKRIGSEEALGTEELDLPQQEFVTEAMWFTLPPEMLTQSEDLVRLPGAIHAIEHALIALLPLFAMCDRWDIGGLSTPVHSQTELPTIFIYDGHAGGVGISRQGFERFREWIRDACVLIKDCPCESGCPSCIQSPKCGNWNEPLDKEAALRLLQAMQPDDAMLVE
jgi:DEAD/DEAH box helicase domain-containing protein